VPNLRSRSGARARIVAIVPAIVVAQLSFPRDYAGLPPGEGGEGGGRVTVLWYLAAARSAPRCVSGGYSSADLPRDANLKCAAPLESAPIYLGRLRHQPMMPCTKADALTAAVQSLLRGWLGLPPATAGDGVAPTEPDTELGKPQEDKGCVLSTSAVETSAGAGLPTVASPSSTPGSAVACGFQGDPDWTHLHGPTC
jgi:hypothetical protein